MIDEQQFGFNAFWWGHLYTEQEIHTCVECLAQIGYGYVEFKRDSFPQRDLPYEFKTAARIAREAGMQVSDFVVLRNLAQGEAQAVEDVIDTIRACAEAGVNILNTTFGSCTPIEAPREWFMPPQTHDATGWDHLARALERICAVAEREHVDLAMEPVVGNHVHDYYTFIELLCRFDHPRLCLTFDPSHFALYRNDIAYAVRELATKIRHVHLKDAVGVPGILGLDFLFPSLGSGAIDWTDFLGALDDIGYTGVLSGEYEQFKYMEQVLRGDAVWAARVTYHDMCAVYAHYREDKQRS